MRPQISNINNKERIKIKRKEERKKEADLTRVNKLVCAKKSLQKNQRNKKRKKENEKKNKEKRKREREEEGDRELKKVKKKKVCKKQDTSRNLPLEKDQVVMFWFKCNIIIIIIIIFKISCKHR